MFAEFLNIIFKSIKLEKSLYRDNKNFGEAAIYFAGLIMILDGLAGAFAANTIVKTAIGSEKKVAQEMHARLSGTGSLQTALGEIFGVLHPTQMRGYVFVEASAKHHVEKLIGRVGGKDRASRGVVATTPLKNAKGVLGAEVPLKDVLPYLEPKSATTGIDIGCLVEIVSGAFKGEKARVIAVADTKEEISMELYEADIPMTLNMRADHVRVIERIE